MDRTMLVLGAGSGTGAAVARRFGREGFHVAVVGRRREPLDTLVADLAGGGVSATAFSVDLTDDIRVEELLTAVDTTLPPIEAIYYGPLQKAHTCAPANKDVRDDRARHDLRRPRVAEHLCRGRTRRR